MEPNIRVKVGALYQSMKRFDRLTAINKQAPDDFVKSLIERERRRTAQLRAELFDAGYDPDLVLKKAWLSLEGNEIESERRERCLVRLRAAQARNRTGDVSIESYDCFLLTEGVVDNCMNCPSFIEATEEQQVSFNHGCDLETGESDPKIVAAIDKATKEVEDDESPSD